MSRSQMPLQDNRLTNALAELEEMDKQKKPKVLSEKQIEAKIGEYVKKHDGLYYKFSSPGQRGVPDRIVVMPFRIPIFMEVKRHDGKLSDGQRKEITRLRERGARAFVVYSVEQGIQVIDEVMR